MGVVKVFWGGDEGGSLASSISANFVVVYDDGIGGTGGGGDIARGGIFNCVGIEYSPFFDVASKFKFQSMLKSRLLTCNLGSRGGGDEEDRGRAKDGSILRIQVVYICGALVPKQHK